ncbi:hypothetical protein EBZ38_08950 [bacterium]|nr:hypothetical protein [bacterium]NDD84382.1 hypothetical protein [bacterium]
MNIDTQFNFQAALGDPDKDADKYSLVLQDYHQFLWSKPLPNGRLFELEKLNTSCLLRYKSEDIGMFLSSDRAVATYTRWKRLQHIVNKIPQQKIDDFINITETIGGIIIWPSTKVDGKSTINGERGFNRKICDRLDLTIECIRRYYANEDSPLYDTFKRYDDFFRLFENFKGYVEFFLFQDFVGDDYNTVKVAVPFNNFTSSPVPSTEQEYLSYMDHTTNLVKARNNRIKSYVEGI